MSEEYKKAVIYFKQLCRCPFCGWEHEPLDEEGLLARGYTGENVLCPRCERGFKLLRTCEY